MLMSKENCHFAVLAQTGVLGSSGYPTAHLTTHDALIGLWVSSIFSTTWGCIPTHMDVANCCVCLDCVSSLPTGTSAGSLWGMCMGTEWGPRESNSVQRSHNRHVCAPKTESHIVNQYCASFLTRLLHLAVVFRCSPTFLSQASWPVTPPPVPHHACK